MALYFYRAFSREGKRISGTLDAPTEMAVREAIQKMGLYPIKIERSREGTGTLWQRLKLLFARPVSLKDKILFTKQLSVLLKSGVPLLQALELLVDQFEGRLRSILIDVKDGIKEGLSLTDGLKLYPSTFDNIFVQLVRAGEATGKLEIILDRLTSYLERRETIRKKVRSAMQYPLIQLTIIGLVVVALLTFVVPQLAETFEAQEADLPLTTQILMGASEFVQSYWLLLLIMIIIGTIAFKYWASTQTGARTLDKIKLRLPIIKFFARIGAVTQFCRTLGILIESGVNLPESLDIVVNIIDNRILADALVQARDKIIKQGRIAEFLKQTDIFPPIAIYLIKTGEESGKLDYMLLTVAQNYEVELSDYADGLSTLLEPLMLVVMGVVVGFIVLSVMQPIMQQAEGFNI